MRNMLVFEDIEPEAFPPGSQFFYNVKVWIMLIQQQGEEFLPQDIQEQWYCQDLTSPMPCVLGILRTDLIDEDFEYEMECHSNCVVEISERQSVCWYSRGNAS